METNTILRQGSKGPEVIQLQQLLIRNGYTKVRADGDFGPATHAAAADFQGKNGLSPDGIVGNMTKAALRGEKTDVNIAKNVDTDLVITDKFLNDDEYYKEICKKTTIYLHHTAGSPSAANTIGSWELDKDKAGSVLKVATAFVVGGPSSKDPNSDGQVLRAFDEKYWAHHLGTKLANNKQLNQQSIGIEVCNYGPLTLTRDGKYLNYVNSEIDAAYVYKLDKPYRGFIYYQEYSDKQVESLKLLLIYLRDKYSIDIKKAVKWGRDSFELDGGATTGQPGVYVHGNCRSDKFDISPSPKMIAMLNTL